MERNKEEEDRRGPAENRAPSCSPLSLPSLELSDAQVCKAHRLAYNSIPRKAGIEPKHLILENQNLSQLCEDRDLDGPASGEMGSKGRN